MTLRLHGNRSLVMKVAAKRLMRVVKKLQLRVKSFMLIQVDASPTLN